MEFGESLIRFEALTETPLREAFGSIPLDKQLDLLDGLVTSVQEYATANGMPHPNRKTWAAYRKTANWDSIAKQALLEKSFFRGKSKILLDLFSKQ